MLGRGEVHVWFAPMERVPAPLMQSYARLLSDVERGRELRFRFESDRRLYRLTRAAQRSVLSMYCDVSPMDWQFGEEEGGRPTISGPNHPQISFNLSNTDGLVACAVSLHRVGVDVENVIRRPAPLEIADHYFCRAEVNQLLRLDAEQRTAHFYELWTLKESYLKARGIGLGLPLDRFGFIGEPLHVHFDPELGDRADDWRFRALRLPPHHQAAVAVQLPSGTLTCRFFEIVPCSGDAPRELTL